MDATDTAVRMMPQKMEATDTVMRTAPAKESKERDAQSQKDQTSAVQESASQDIASLAYALWEERGRPLGSAEQDWSGAEEFLSRHMVRTASVGG